uniref:Smr domain-containing protein n=1 Tax=Trichogramma kaykai TaxID=54128 RepID=A0ABD2XQR6_9HYME
MKQISDQLKTKEDYNKDFDILLKKSQELFVLRQNLDEKNIAACFDFEEKLRSVVQSTFDKKWGPHKVYLIILRYIILGAQLNLKKEDPTITLDLHYFSWLEAREILKKFLTFHRARESKRVTVVTGQGKRTGGGILRERSPELIEKERMRWSTSKTNPGRLESLFPVPKITYIDTPSSRRCMERRRTSDTEQSRTSHHTPRHIPTHQPTSPYW